MRLFIAALVLLLGTTTATADPTGGKDCPVGATPLLILGTFHMEGSAEDAVSTHAGDMSTARRQAEITGLVQSLARFRPTRVAIESSRVSTYWNEQYRAWRAGTRPLGSNEIEQIGFRLAVAVGLEALSPIDYPMWMDGTQAIDRHEPRPQPAQSAAQVEAAQSPLLTDIRAEVAADEARLRESTVSEFLAWINSPPRAALHHRWDVISNLAPGSGSGLYETTDLATNWYKRNLRIYTNLVDISGPGERVLLIIGAGHTHLLTSLADEDPRFCVADVARYLQ